MSPLLLGCLVTGLLLFGVGQAEGAVSVTVTYTGDNVVLAAYQNGGSPVTIPVAPNATNWPLADTFTLHLDYATEYQFVLLAQNYGTSGRPILRDCLRRSPAT